MTQRKKKLLIIQILLIISSLIIIFYTYTYNNNKNEEIISKSLQKKIEKDLDNQNVDGDVFYNIEYSGIDLNGNRYILRSKEARTENQNQNIVSMKEVTGVFYFKDDTVMNIQSTSGIYNNKTLDIIFTGDVEAYYNEGELFAQKAEYNNSENYLKLTEDVHIRDIKGEMFADELFFDIKKKTLNIASYKNNKINSNINLK
tara:strand:- start:1162 stop:1764 length:603 start_codon:yes stop_codon:yes gene_type:complete